MSKTVAPTLEPGTMEFKVFIQLCHRAKELALLANCEAKTRDFARIESLALDVFSTISFLDIDDSTDALARFLDKGIEREDCQDTPAAGAFALHMPQTPLVKQIHHAGSSVETIDHHFRFATSVMRHGPRRVIRFVTH